MEFTRIRKTNEDAASKIEGNAFEDGNTLVLRNQSGIQVGRFSLEGIADWWVTEQHEASTIDLS